MAKEFASGGTILSGDIKWEPPLPRGCEYIIPWPLARRLLEAQEKYAAMNVEELLDHGFHNCCEDINDE